MNNPSEKEASTMGSLSWGQVSNGVLNQAEQEQLLGNLTIVMNQESLDAERVRLGLLKPKHIAIESITPPNTKMVTDALALAEETHVPALLRHSWRTYYFGALIALHDGIEFDRELSFTASILHDLGMTTRAHPKPCNCCFAVSGALQTRDFLVRKGHSEAQATEIARAIAVHMNLHVPYERHGAVAFVVTRGAVCDVFGAGVSRMSPASIKEVLARYSREDLYTVLSPAACEHLAGVRLDVLFKAIAGAKEQAPPHPLDTAPYA